MSRVFGTTRNLCGLTETFAALGSVGIGTGRTAHLVLGVPGSGRHSIQWADAIVPDPPLYDRKERRLPRAPPPAQRE